MSAQTTKKKNTRWQDAFQTYIWPRRKMLGIGLLLVLINRSAGLVLPGASKYFFDDVLPNKDMNLLWMILIVVSGAVIVQSITSFILVRLLSVQAQHMIAQLRSSVQAHVIKLPINFFDNTKTGALVSRIMTDVEGVRNLVGTGFTQLIGGVFTALAALAILFSISPTLTLFSLLPLIIFFFVTLKAFGRIRPIFRERGKIQAEVTGRLTESMGGIRVIKGFHAEGKEVSIFKEGVLRLYRNIKSSLTATALVSSTGTLLAGLTTAGIMGMGAPMFWQETLTDGDIVSFILYLAVLIFPFIQMSNIGSQLTDALAGLDRTQELLDTPREVDDQNRTETIGEITGDILFDKVDFSYEEGKPVLKDVSFEAPAGSVTALVGSSGSGKSTIAGLVAAFLQPNAGKITIDGQDLSKINLESYRSKLGVVLQDDFLFEGTIRENIMYARADATEDELTQAIEGAYVSEFSDRFAEGLETVIGERGVKLSGGQRQRVAIARAMLADPSILILDEATSNLDTESEAFIQKSLQQLMEGRTTIVIAHRLTTIRKADQILVIEAGEIVERGQHDELLASNGRYHDLYTYQARI